MVLVWFLHGPHVIPTSLVAAPCSDQEHHFGVWDGAASLQLLFLLVRETKGIQDYLAER